MTEFKNETSKQVYYRTYSRTKPDGSQETWPETVRRVVDGNLKLVEPRYIEEGEREALIDLIEDFKVLPAGRHLKSSGVNDFALNNCLAGGTPVHTREGVYPIRELTGTHEVLSEGGVYRKAEFKSFGVQKLLRVTLTTGEAIEATPDHEWVIAGKKGRKYTRDLKPGDRIPLNLVKRPETNWDYWLGVANGIVYGDGSISGPSSFVVLCGDKRELAQYVLPYSKNDEGSEQAAGLYIGRLPIEFKALPSLEENPSYWRGFINGLVATDGNVKNGSVRVFSSSIEDLMVIALGAARAGIATHEPKMMREFSPYTGDYAPVWSMTLKGGCFIEEDTLREKHKGTKFPKTPRTTSVVSVEDTGRKEEVFCCVEMETHTMTVGCGILTGQCWAAGWDPAKPEEHFTFTLLRLAEGGGVGSNYSARFLEDFSAVQVPVQVHIVCDPEHQDYEDMVEAGLISTEYSHTWAGAYAVEDSREGWAEALGDLIRTAHDPKTRHTQRVYDVSRVRCKGSPLKTFGGTASGPEPFAEMMWEVGEILAGVFRRGDVLDVFDGLNGLDAMRIDHAIAKAIVAGGVRRSARMSIMRWDDDLIFDFINIKKKGGHWTTNISVEVDEKFFEHLNILSSALGPISFVTEEAHCVLQAIAEGMLHNGEPGVWNSALTAEGEVDGTYVTNPCGEATLTPWEPCNLGSVNLAAFVNSFGDVDFRGLVKAHRLITRYLIRATFADVADPKSAEAIARYRRIGVGHLGFADFLYHQGIKYTEAPFDGWISSVLTECADEVDLAASEYANELRIPVPIKKRVIAPTGTISKLAGVSGEATHAPFAGYFIRRIRFSDLEPNEVAQVEEYRKKGYRVEKDRQAANTSIVEIPTKDSLLDELEFPEYFQHAGELTIRDMLNVQQMYQEHWADQAVSYTANVDPTKYTAEELAGLLAEYLPGLKGTTVFPELSFDQAPYERVSFEEYKARAEEVGIEVTDTGFDEVCASGACPV
ncbi:ribonucleoside-triphosphate reductase, adenosylcobalamin-dependent [Streptomyces sp. WG5]|uniref:ribonucleoside-triphosphate reductase, adenosylcobalamin-dependent n=1 Tax=Streptomyces sp. WG5 TaxID=3417648 RepID=UPI003CF63151